MPTNPANTVDATSIANAQADAALQNEALAPALRHAITERLVSTQSSSKTIDVTVDALGRTTVHDKDQSASPVLGIVTAVVDIAAAIPTLQPVAVPLAIALNAGQAVNDFAHGDTVNGLIHAGSAVGFGYLSPLVGVNKDLAAKIFEATAALAGTNSVVQSARTGSALGVIAGALEVTAGLAGGLISYKAFDTATLNTIHSITVGLGIAAGATAGAAAIQRGDLANGLLSGLGAVYGAIEAARQLLDSQQQINSAQYGPASNNTRIAFGKSAYLGFVSLASNDEFVPSNLYDPYVGTSDFLTNFQGSQSQRDLVTTYEQIQKGAWAPKEVLSGTDLGLPGGNKQLYFWYPVGPSCDVALGAGPRIVIPVNDPTSVFYGPKHGSPTIDVPNGWVHMVVTSHK